MVYSVRELKYFLDDVIIGSPSYETHLADLEKVFARFQAANVRMSPTKTHLCYDELIYLGFRINQEGVSITQDRVEALKRF